MKKMNNKFFALLFFPLICFASQVEAVQNHGKKDKTVEAKKIQVEKFKDRNTGCEISYEYYVSPSGEKVMNGKYRRKWSMPKNDVSTWSGYEDVKANFVEGRLTGIVEINCEKYKWKRKSEFVKGKGRVVSMMPIESYVAHDLRLSVKNDTLCEVGCFVLGNYKYELEGTIENGGELHGIYTLYEKNDQEPIGDRVKSVTKDWIQQERFVCDPTYTYKDAVPLFSEIHLGYPGTSKGEQIHIKMPRLRLRINSY